MPQRHRFVAFLQFGTKSLKSLKPVPYDRQLSKLSDHLRKRRYETGLLQREAASLIEISHETYALWENEHAYPDAPSWPKLIEWLGYDPTGEPKTLGQRLKSYRRLAGISRVALARQIGCDPGTLRKWECGFTQPNDDHHKQLLRLIKPAI